jgi:uncharacterized protein YbjQ (UPF0145 family)
MVLTTTPTIPGKEIQILGIVKGSVVRAKHIGRDIMSGFRSIVGGELYAYTELMNESRSVATTRMLEEALKFDADAVVNVRYETASVAQGACEIIVYGTAVKIL